MGVGSWLRRVFGGEPASPINVALMGAFKAHGVECSHRGGWITFSNGMRVAGAVGHVWPVEVGIGVQLDICLEIDPDRAIFESFVGGGLTSPQAVSDAMISFSMNSFHVFLAAFFDKLGEHGVERVDCEIGGSQKKVTVGPLGFRGRPPIDGEQGEKLTACLNRFNARLKAHPFSPGTHWVRLFCAQEGGRLTACEVLQDNQTWVALQSEMGALEWPASEDFYSVRNFLIIQNR